MAIWTRRQIAKTVDHAALKPNMTDRDIQEQCELGRKFAAKSVCVRPSGVPLATKLLAGCETVVSVVIGFPHGANKPETKALEAKLAIEDGAKELDMVMNIGKFLSGDFDWGKRDIEAVVAKAKPKGVLVKVIFGTCFLKPDEIKKACEIVRDAGAGFVKTSTGFADGSATPEAIDMNDENGRRQYGRQGVRRRAFPCDCLRIPRSGLHTPRLRRRHGGNPRKRPGIRRRILMNCGRHPQCCDHK